jgi:hypothetical protein
MFTRAIRNRAAMLVLAVVPLTAGRAAAAPKLADARASASTVEAHAAASSDAGAVDSESLLIRRRAERLRLLPAPPKPPQVDFSTINPIDQFIADAWWKAGITADRAPQVCDDATYARRVYLDVIGRIPSVAEANRFLAAAGLPSKRDKLVDQLLARNEDYAAHWTPFWEDALASQSVLNQGGIPTRGNYRDWIFQSFVQNRPYDVMVAELLDPTMPRRKQADTDDIFGIKYSIAYVRNEDRTVTLQTAANVGQVFLGTSMKCASCHDHFENSEWPQDRFLGFAGLFAPQNLERVRCEVRTGKIVPAQFPFDLPGATERVPTDIDQRLHLAAQWIVDPANPRFAKTIVNRLWKRYLGLGLFEPVDDFREDVPPSHPDLLDWLAYDFVAHDCDLKHTIRLILTSRTYQLRYDPELEDRRAAGGKPPRRLFRSPALRRLTAEQLLDSVRVATAGHLDPAERCYLDARSTALMRALGRPASRNEISTARPDDVAVVQALELLNGRELHALVYESPAVTRLPARQDPSHTVDHLYRAVLTRPATAEEKRLGKVFVGASETPSQAVGDMLWALIASPEFQYIK